MHEPLERVGQLGERVSLNVLLRSAGINEAEAEVALLKQLRQYASDQPVRAAKRIVGRSVSAAEELNNFRRLHGADGGGKHCRECREGRHLLECILRAGWAIPFYE